MLDSFDEWLRSYFHGFKTVKNDSSSNVVIFNCLISLYDVLIAFMSRLAPLKPYFSYYMLCVKLTTLVNEVNEYWLWSHCTTSSLSLSLLSPSSSSPFFCKDGIIKTKRIIIITVISTNKINTKRLWWSWHCLLKWICFTSTFVILNFKQNSFNINIKLVW